MFFTNKIKAWFTCWEPKVKTSRYLHNLRYYFWCTSTPFIWINIGFVFFISLMWALFIPWGMVFFIYLYIVFLMFAYVNFYGSKKFSKLKLKGIEDYINEGKKAYEADIRGAVAKDLKIKPNDPQLYFIASGGKNCGCKKLKLLIKQEAFVVFLGEYRFRIYTKCAGYDLLHPKLAKKCTPAGRACGDNTEHYYTRIEEISLSGGAVHIEFDTGKSIDIKAGGSNKKILEFIREKRRDIEKSKKRDNLKEALHSVEASIKSLKTKEEK